VLWLFHPLPQHRQVARNQFYGNQWDELDYETHRTLTHYPGRDMRVTAIK
jgi:hypothetical protein